MTEKPALWKLIGGGLIVAIAFLIMMPGLIDYVGRIGRVLLLVVVAVAIALPVVLLRHKIFGGKQPGKGGAPERTGSPVEPTADN